MVVIQLHMAMNLRYCMFGKFSENDIRTKNGCPESLYKLYLCMCMQL